MSTQPTSRTGNARALLAKGDAAGAEKEFRAALEADARDAAALVGLAQALIALDRKTEALEPIERAAALHVERGNADKAIGVYRRVVGIDPMRADTHLKIADLLHGLKRTRESLDSLRAAAEAFRAKGQPKERLATMGRLLERTPEPERSPIRLQIAEALATDGRTKEALHIYREESRMLEAGSALEIIGNRGSTRSPTYALLVGVLEKIVALDPTDLLSVLKLGRYQLAGRPARAIATLQNALKLDRKNVEALRLLDHAFLAIGQFDKAALTFEEVRVLAADAYIGSPIWADEARAVAPSLGEIDQLAERNVDEARDKARALIATRPGSIPARLKMAELFARTANLDAAITEVNAAVALALEVGDVVHARGVLQEGLRLAASHPLLRETCVRVVEVTNLF